MYDNLLKNKGNINSAKCNLKKRVLDRRLDDIINQKKNYLKIREKYQATVHDPSPTFYHTMAKQSKGKSRIDFCEITLDNGDKHELTHPVEIAEHITAIYEKTFNNSFHSDITSLIN